MLNNYYKKIIEIIRSEVLKSDLSIYSEIAEIKSYYPITIIDNSLIMALGLSLSGSLVVTFLAYYYFIINIL